MSGECTHEKTRIRVKLRGPENEPVMVGHQCVACRSAVKPIGQKGYWLPRSHWPKYLEEWDRGDEVARENPTGKLFP